MKTEERMVGVKIYEYDKDFVDLIIEWRALGFNTAFVSPSLLSNDAFRVLTKQYGIAIFVILHIFYNPEELEVNPDLFAITDRGQKAREAWVSFVCPSRRDYQQRRIEYIKTLVRDFKPDGISLDFIRHFVYWEKIYPERTLDSLPNTCFDALCLGAFQKEAGITIPEAHSTIRQKAQWLLGNHPQEWTDWKCSLITTLVKDIVTQTKQVKPDVLVNVHTVPWRRDDFGGAIRKIAGQDLAQISRHADYISPMCYSHMLKRGPSWISSVVGDVHSQVVNKVVPCIQVKEHYLTERFEARAFEQCLTEALKPPSHGVAFWSWDALGEDPQKKDVIKAYMG